MKMRVKREQMRINKVQARFAVMCNGEDDKTYSYSLK